MWDAGSSGLTIQNRARTVQGQRVGVVSGRIRTCKTPFSTPDIVETAGAFYLPVDFACEPARATCILFYSIQVYD